MNKRGIVLSVLLSIFMVGLSIEAAPAKKKPWTFLVYIAGDNNLADYVGLDLIEMMKVGSNSNVNVLAYTTVKKWGEAKKTVCYEVLPGALKQVGATRVEDSGSVKTFIKALEWAHVEYPSDQFAVVLWNHGSGTLNPYRNSNVHKGICWDDTTGNYLTDRDCFDAFGFICENYRNGKKIDVVACDACLMASLEVAYTFNPYVDYFVASEENIPGYGFQYSYVLAPFLNNAPSPKKFVKSMVKSYGECYKYSGDDYTLSALNLKRLNPFVENLDVISQFFITQLRGTNRVAVKNALARTIPDKVILHFGNEDYLDAYQWLKNVRSALRYMNLNAQDKKKINNLLKETLSHARRAIVSRVYNANYRKAYGMSIYFPATYIDSSYHNLLWTEWTEWTNFLEAFIAA